MLLDDGCFKTGGYLLTNFMLPSSALPSEDVSNNLDSCNPNYYELETTYNRKTPKNIVLSATGKFLFDGSEYTLSGISNPFNIYAFENRHAFYRKGEDRNVYDIIREALPFDTHQYTNFNTYLSAIAGEGDTLGKAYDKIHNFAQDHSDIDTCTVDNLFNKATMLDDPMEEYGLAMPEELRRLFDFTSVPLKKLIGTRCVCNTNFVDCVGCATTNVCKLCKFDKRSNLGDKILLTDYISAGTTILYKETGNKVFNFLTVSPQDTNVFLLRSLSAEPIYSRGIENYCFYKWDASPQNNPIEGMVNFKDPRNRLLPALSSNEDWYGDGGVVEELFNYVLTKNILNT
jgi:hypothetical protein